jgi:hypothetical protein
MTHANVIRETASRYIAEARKRGDDKVTIVAGDIHRELGLHNLVPSVCSALGSENFLEQNQVELIGKEGPPSGKSTTVKFTYRLTKQSKVDAFAGLRGIAKDLFKSLGGGEAYLKKERQEFDRK